jgi:hypothetical protein
MKRLTEIANKYSCDKGTESYEKHGYTEVYDELFKELPPPVKMLEIGVMDPRFPGASVKMWKEYFPDLLFVGLDINKDAESLRESGTIIYIGDQNSKEDLLNLLIITGGDYDIIIDDGSPDGTAAIVQSLFANYPGQLFLEERKGKLGLGTAYIHGIKWA